MVSICKNNLLEDTTLSAEDAKKKEQCKYKKNRN